MRARRSWPAYPDELVLDSAEEAQIVVNVARLEMLKTALQCPFWDEDDPRQDPARGPNPVMNNKTIKPLSPDDFYKAYAIAMLNWQKVESALFRLLYSLFEGGNLEQVGAAFYSQDSFGAKLRLVDATAGSVLRDPRLAEWTALNRDLGSASAHRNVLAHLPAVVEFGADGSMGLVLQPSLYVPENLRRRKNRKYDAGQCEQLANEFEALEFRLDTFAAAGWKKPGQ